jgi:hypothetical protein
LLATILEACPGARGVVFDLPHVADGAGEYARKAQLAERCSFVAGDFFESVPPGGDIYLLKSIIHNWDDERCVVILGNCRRAMSRDCRLVLVERVMPARVEASIAHQALARSDLNMLVGIGGKERTEAQIRSLLEQSGFTLALVRATEIDYSVIEGVPAFIPR